ncbi:MAG: polysaccharide deacetylase family protein [Bacteroidota bacterium]
MLRIAIFFILLLLIGLLLRLYGRHPARAFFIEPITHFSTSEQQIALTFDDGPSPSLTPAVLDLLAKYQLKATFFVNGNKLEASPAIARRAVAEGHQLANHTYAHDRMVFQSPAFMEADLRRTDSLVGRSGEQALSYFRPPFGDKFVVLPLVLRRLGKPCVNWNVEPEAQYEAPFQKEQFVQQTLAACQPGSIILLHDGWAIDEPAFLAGVDEILKQLKQKGYSFVRIKDVVAAQ